jgi:hypothetical protein
VKKFPRLKAGESLTARHLNVIFAELERLSKLTVVGAERFTNGEDGPTIVIGDGSGGGAVLVKAPSGGIPGRNASTGVHGTASCTLYDDDGSKLTLSSTTETVHNWVTAVVGAGEKDVVCVRSSMGYLVAINEVCS